MKSMSIYAVVLGLAGLVAAGELDMGMDFNLMPRALTNLQTFTGELGNAPAPAITNSGSSTRPFQVDGDTFTDFTSAATRACNNQHNTCADTANTKGSNIKVSDCDQQQTQCLATQSTATNTGFQVLVSQDANFDYICDGNI